jgi:CheY-like chemotaxis protein
MTKPRVVNVLLIEDNPHVADLIAVGMDSWARRDGGAVEYHFDVVYDGQSGLEQLEVRAPDLIICDLYMPVMDGALFLKHLRAHARASKTPVIALSAGGAGAREAALDAGADVYFDKPIRLQEVRAAAARLLHLG